jgi:magnesium chelatase subunit D
MRPQPEAIGAQEPPAAATGQGALTTVEAVALAVALSRGAPETFGGIRLVGPPGPAREAILDAIGETRRIPFSADFERLVGGLDLTATLAAGAPRMARGVLADGTGPLLVPSAERIAGEVAGLLAVFLDGQAEDAATEAPMAPRMVVALDESEPDDPPLDARLTERLAFVLTADMGVADPVAVPALPPHWREVTLGQDVASGLTEASLSLGVPSLRADIHAYEAAKAIAAVRGRGEATDTDVAAAVALVLLPRATRMPSPPPPPPPEEDEEESEPPEPPRDDAANDNPPEPPEKPDETPQDTETDQDPQDAGDRFVDAAAAALDADLLAALSAAAAPRGVGAGRAGRKVKGGRGRPVGVRAGVPGRDGRIALVETLTAAAPWRAVRGGADGRIPVRQSDLRVRRTKSRAATSTIFAVDASGSQALARMAEAKGAVECLLADAYVRRDEVALVAFRKDGAEVLLPPTSSLTRAKRALAALPGGGGTPLASGLTQALNLARQSVRAGREPTIVVLTDARANVTLAGEGGRAAARQDASAAARAIRAEGIPVVLVDTAPRPGEAARALAAEMDARYAPLPRANPQGLAALAGRGAR